MELAVDSLQNSSLGWFMRHCFRYLFSSSMEIPPMTFSSSVRVSPSAPFVSIPIACMMEYGDIITFSLSLNWRFISSRANFECASLNSSSIFFTSVVCSFSSALRPAVRFVAYLEVTLFSVAEVMKARSFFLSCTRSRLSMLPSRLISARSPTILDFLP